MRAHRPILLVALFLAPKLAVADGNDLHLSRLLDDDAVKYDAKSGAVTGVVRSPASETRYRTLMSELGTVMALRVLEPADTLGLSGFNFSFDFATTNVSAKNPGDDPWQAAERRPGSGVATYGMFLRKGLWIPAPAVELGVGTMHLLDSDLWALQAYAKIGLFEGFHGWPIPSVAIRGGGSRIVGAREVDLTVANFDMFASKSIGIGGTVTLIPFFGWSQLWIVPRGQVLDATPWCDALVPGDSDAEHPCPAVQGGDSAANFTFRDQSVITRNRLFFGAKLKFYVTAVALEYAYFFSGKSTDPGTTETITDRAPGQSSVSGSVSIQF